MSEDPENAADPSGTEPPSRSERDIAAELKLRPERPSVTRVSRKVLVTAGAVSSVAVVGAVLFALQTGKHGGHTQELYSTDSKTTADGLANLPRDYAGIPRNVPVLGPPLPGDLGRPIVAAQNQGQAVPVPANGPMPAGGPPPVDQEVQRVAQEREAARLSKLFSGTAIREQDAGGGGPALGGFGVGQAIAPDGSVTQSPSTDDADARQNGQAGKLAFLNAASDKRTVSPDRLQRPASPYVVQAGAIIAGALVTGIRSDLPGQITGQVTENVYDTPTGRFLLIPQGSKLIGTYDSQVASGQSRVLLVWTRLLLPNGTSIVLERQPGADAQGYAGLEDGVDEHWGSLFKGALLSTLLSIGSEAGTSGQENSLVQALRRGASDSISQTGNQVVRRQLNVQPTLTIRPGYPVRVIVNRDLVLAPYGA